MCVLAIAHELHPQYRLLVVANRDEYHDRPTAAASFWEDAPNLFGGRDLRRGGTWLGINRAGRLAFVTNFRAPEYLAQGADPKAQPSRGALVRRWLLDREPSHRFVAHMRSVRDRTPGFALVFGEVGHDLCCYQSHTDELTTLGPGLYGLSNHLLDTPWPKVDRVKEGLRRILDRPRVDPAAAFQTLADRRPFDAATLPDTGVGPELERALSPVFIAGPTYGTRSSTIFTIGPAGAVWFEERRYGPNGVPTGRSTMAMTFEGLTGTGHAMIGR